MKNIITLGKSLALLLILFLVSCNKDEIFEELAVNPNQESLNGFYTSEINVNKAVVGIYGYLSTPRNLGASGRGLFMHHRSDEMSNTSDYGAPGQYNSKLSASWYTIEQPWSLMYVAAFGATDVIEQAPKVEFRNEDLKNAYLGEAYALRAFAHWYLLINWRNIPLITEIPENRDEFVKPQVAPMEAWNQIIADLQKAKELLPNKEFWDEENKGRLTKASAAALLGKTYLYMTGIENIYGNESLNYYQEAAAEFGAIINGDYGNYTLTPDYSWNFGVDHENNDESIWEFQFLGDTQINTGFNPGSVTSGLFADPRAFAPPGYLCGSCETVVHNWVYETFVNSIDNDGKTDRRMFGTMLFDDLAPEIAIPDLNENGDFTDDRNYGVAGMTFEEMYPPEGGLSGFAVKVETAAPYKAANKKWIDYSLPLDDETGSRFNNARAHGVNWRFIRYADVLLMYAESVLQGGNATSISALEAVNQVRERANMPLLGGLSMEDIKRERILELSLEGTRALDLLRWGELESRFSFLETNDPNFKGFDTYTGFVPHKNEWLPIPIDEVEANPLGKQNPGW